jgi:hypothetical protein
MGQTANIKIVDEKVKIVDEKVNDFLKNMEFGRRYKVDERQAELVKDWMQGRKYDGGINFSADWKTIYKVDVSMLK